MRRCSWLLAVMAAPLFSIGGQGLPPAASVVAAKAQAVHLDVSRSVKAALPGRVVTFTPVAEADLPPDLPTLEKGAVVGVVAIAGGEGTLAAGQYNVFVTRTSAGWQTALERGGKIATVSRAVTVAAYPIEHGIPKPMITVGTGAADNDQSNAATPVSFVSYHPDRGAVEVKDSITITVHIHGWTIKVTVDL